MNAQSPVDIANQRQREASDPEVSAFVSASAGSGKTKLLTDRLLRLMLSGAEPGRIQCLTFTKAAAAEMAMRLQRRLGKWVTLDDAALDRDLREIGVVPNDDLRRTARALFARVLDLPGGMRIGTIHAFCQSLLRRFPLEAQLSPHFTLADERDSAEAWQQAREAMLAGSTGFALSGFLDDVAPWGSLEAFGTLVQSLAREPERVAAIAPLSHAALIEILKRVLGAEALSERAVLGVDNARLLPQLRTLAERGSPAVKDRAIALLDWLGLETSERFRLWSVWTGEFFDKSGKERSFGSFPNKKAREFLPELESDLLREQQRIAAILDADRAFHLAPVAAAFILLAQPVLRAYSETKSLHGRLDYDDLIARTEQLLRDPGAAWVLYKLDGGLDHLLLDEVQDTAPAQWQIAGQLTDEFFAGEGAQSNKSRTVFAVGDRKQSIYGFQGADPEAFEHWRARTGQRVTRSGQEWRDVPLNVSFRSTAPVLQLVDTVFAEPAAARGVVGPDEILQHIVFREGVAGRIELWPLAEAQADTVPDFWAAPRINRGQRSPMQVLADTLAHTIRGWIDSGERLESQDRAIRPGDILVLVRRRNAFCNAFVNALKAKGVAVAGLDRITLTEEPAVQDMLTLCDTLLLPEDDLSLACVLTSPLGYLTDDQLMTLAMNRPEGRTLWQTLLASHDPACAETAHFLRQMFARADHVSPHALLAEALGPLGGRARLLARFGHEAAEPLDELLAASLRYSQTHPPSLQGFVHWLRQTASSVKREPEGAGGETLDAVRIMTVHGAKGLQAPVVILPDTTGKPPVDTGIVWLTDAQSGLELPVWCPSSQLRCDAIARKRGGGAAAQEEEKNRLLYVALTRAEDRLLVCGWKGKNKVEENCWYRQIDTAFDTLGLQPTPYAAGKDGFPAEIRFLHTAQTADAKPPRAAELSVVADLPKWAGAAPLWQPLPPPEEPPLPQPLAPSRPDGAALGEVPEADSPLLARDTAGLRFRRGQVVHALLQHLPDLPADTRRTAALDYIQAALPDLPAPDALLREVMAVLDHPALAALFGPGSRAEVPISGVVAGKVIGGLIDRMAILPDRILLADYKTNRNPPKDVTATPVLYLRQLAAYSALLRAVFVDRPVTCALIWTVGAQPMLLPDDLLDGHAPGTDSPG